MNGAFVNSLRLSAMTAVAFAALSAQAADMYSPRVSMKDIPVPMFTWSGFYAGVNSGYGWGAYSVHGEVETLAGWIARARRGNYFKWQLANRLGRVAQRLEELSGGPAGDLAVPNAVQAYLSAGIGRSFVDFPNSHRPFHRLINPYFNRQINLL